MKATGAIILRICLLTEGISPILEDINNSGKKGWAGVEKGEVY